MDELSSRKRLLIATFIVVLCLLDVIGSHAAAGESARDLKVCNGSNAECEEENEMLMESEVSRRILAQSPGYIVPGALKKDQPVCDSGARGNPYIGPCIPEPSKHYSTAGCPRYYRCGRDTN
ncbi:hypothetical protein Droror1_Dr00009689 [Drosera rotundifolia]